jgi:thioesterase domain-containing protein
LASVAQKTGFTDAQNPHLGSEGIVLNQGNAQKVFCFPPALGIGLAFSKLARHTGQANIIAFDFVEAENRVEQYVRQILKHQPEGPYVLSAHSAGGVLVFETAKMLEKMGHQVSGLVLFDAMPDHTRLEVEGDIEANGDDSFLERLYAAIGIEDNGANRAYIETIKARSESYQAYFSRQKQEGKIAANVHYILPSDVDEGFDMQTQKDFQEQAVKMWREFTTGKVRRYQGVGTHAEMIRGENVATNACLFDEILRAL